MKIVATIEARTGSTRLPNKVLREILGQPMLARIIERARHSRRLHQIVVATTDLPQDRVLVELAGSCGVSAFRGSEEDLLSRLHGAVEFAQADILVSLTGDNPFIDPRLIDDMVDAMSDGAQYVATTHMQHARHWAAQRTFPIGVSVQVLYADLVREQHREQTEPAVRHLGLYPIYDCPDQRYRRLAFEAVGPYAGWRHPELRMTVDTEQDFQLATRVYEELYPREPAFSTGEAIALIASRPELRDLNREVRQRIGHQEAARARGD